MADLDDVDPREVSVPPDEDELTTVPVADPDAEAQADEDRPDTSDPGGDLADDDPNKSW
jgi:hypothetical protein